jgi:hypothetical protein
MNRGNRTQEKDRVCGEHLSGADIDTPAALFFCEMSVTARQIIGIE